MGTKGRQIVGMDVDELLDMLNQAFADEWLAYYQYWLGAKIVKGPMKDAVAAELLLHAGEELAHADMLALRIIQLGRHPADQPRRMAEDHPLRLRSPHRSLRQEDPGSEYRRRAVRHRRLSEIAANWSGTRTRSPTISCSPSCSKRWSTRKTCRPWTRTSTC